jgi:hypothetical protein
MIGYVTLVVDSNDKVDPIQRKHWHSAPKTRVHRGRVASRVSMRVSMRVTSATSMATSSIATAGKQADPVNWQRTG